MEIKQEIEQAAIMSIRCPSCGAEPGHYCRKNVKRGDPCDYKPTCPTHQRRLSTYVVGNISETIGGDR